MLFRTLPVRPLFHQQNAPARDKYICRGLGQYIDRSYHGLEENAMKSSEDLLLCGWRVRSEVPLPELSVWAGTDREPDIQIRIGPICEPPLAGVVHDAHGEVAADGTFLLSEPGVARYRVDQACTVTIEPILDPASSMVRSHLFGTILGVLCHRRGLLPLHASCCLVGGRALIFAGPRDSGKSTLAAMLARRGYPLLADDVTPIVWPAPARPMALAGVPCLRLTADALDRLAVSPAHALDPAYGKMAVPGLAQAARQPAPVGAIFHLTSSTAIAPPGPRPLGRSEAIGALYAACFRGRLAHKMGLGETAFSSIVRLAADCSNFRLPWGGDIEALERLIDTVTSASQEPLSRRAGS
jgi:hypothetical protein